MRGPHHSSRDGLVFFTSAEGGKKMNLSTHTKKTAYTPAKSNSCWASVFKRRLPKVEHAAKKTTARRCRSCFIPPPCLSAGETVCRLPGCAQVCRITGAAVFVCMRCRRDVSLVDHCGIHTLHTSAHLVLTRPLAVTLTARFKNAQHIPASNTNNRIFMWGLYLECLFCCCCCCCIMSSK